MNEGKRWWLREHPSIGDGTANVSYDRSMCNTFVPELVQISMAVFESFQCQIPFSPGTLANRFRVVGIIKGIAGFSDISRTDVLAGHRFHYYNQRQ